MRRSGAWLAVRALENVGIRWTFGIPGVHTTELYDELDRSDVITPVLVTHEGCGAFMADAISRTSESVGCLAIVPAAGLTHAMSGIGEAYLDGIPMLVIAGGIRRDSGRHYQLHDMDQLRLVDGLTKAAFRIERHEDVVSTVYRAHEIATSGEPGPTLVELAAEVQMFTGEAPAVHPYTPSWQPPEPDDQQIAEAARMLAGAEHPGLYLGWGARDATAEAVAVAEILAAPVATTLQGVSVFPADHPLHTGMGFGGSSVPAARRAFEHCDALLAVGVRFAELATGSYGMNVPEQLIHVDINPQVFHQNHRARVAIHADARDALGAIRVALSDLGARRDRLPLQRAIARDKSVFLDGWIDEPQAESVNPGRFFRSLRRELSDDAIMVVDDGNHTFLAAELFPVHASRGFISPTDFNCMGYCVPAAIGAKLANPGRQVAAVVGDGAFLMTCMEIVTAATLDLGVVFFVFHDGELAQISQLQELPLKRKSCTVLGDFDTEGVARATGAEFIAMRHDGDVTPVIQEAYTMAATGRPVIVDVRIDYSRKSEFTRGVVKTNLARFPLRQKLRYIGRALKRHTIG